MHCKDAECEKDCSHEWHMYVLKVRSIRCIIIDESLLISGLLAVGPLFQLVKVL